MTVLSRALLIAAVAVAAGLAGYFTREGTRSDAEAGVDPKAGGQLLAMTLPDAQGQPQALAQWRGKVLVMNYWATWCPPCRREIPDFAAVSRAFSEAPVQFVGISIDRVENVTAFAAELDVPYPLLIGSPDTLAMTERLGNRAQALPFTVILDRAGDIRHVRLGTLNQTELEGKIRALLAP